MSRCGIQYLFIELDEEDDIASSDPFEQGRLSWNCLRQRGRCVHSSTDYTVLERIGGLLQVFISFPFSSISECGCLLGSVTRQRRGWELQKSGYNRDTLQQPNAPSPLHNKTPPLFSFAVHRSSQKYVLGPAGVLGRIAKKGRGSLWGRRRITGSFASLRHTRSPCFSGLLGEDDRCEPTSLH